MRPPGSRLATQPSRSRASAESPSCSSFILSFPTAAPLLLLLAAAAAAAAAAALEEERKGGRARRRGRLRLSCATKGKGLRPPLRACGGDAVAAAARARAEGLAWGAMAGSGALVVVVVVVGSRAGGRQGRARRRAGASARGVTRKQLAGARSVATMPVLLLPMLALVLVLPMLLVLPWNGKAVGRRGRSRSSCARTTMVAGPR